jgi:quinone-modifying oxidoreductase, subunit QmoC
MQFLFIKPRKIKKPSRIEEGKMVRRRVKYEAELDHTFSERLGPAFGEQVLSCIQCGTCSATCPLSHYMDYSPRRIIAMVREGFRDELLNSYTIWLCASCYACTVECPREIKITDLMYALKREAMRTGAHPKRFTIPVFTGSFFRQVQRYGRQNESRLITMVYLLSNPVMLLRNVRLALRLFVRGRLSFFDRGIKQKKSFKKLMRSVEKADAGHRSTF